MAIPMQFGVVTGLACTCFIPNLLSDKSGQRRRKSDLSTEATPFLLWDSPASEKVFYSGKWRGSSQAQVLLSCLTVQRLTLCTLQNRGTYEVLSQDIALKTRSRWDAIYVLLGIYAFWTILYLLALQFRGKRGKACPSSNINFQVATVVNPIHSQETAGPVLQGKKLPTRM